MHPSLRIGLVGDYDATVPAHQAIPRALTLAAEALASLVHFAWLPTDAIEGDDALAPYDGIWCVPNSPYRSMDGALRAIRFAREHGRPFLGTCGGFQHAVIEYARNVLGWATAEHAESAPGAELLVVTPLSCALVEVAHTVHFRPGTRLATAYGADEAVEGYRCNFGLNPALRDALLAGELHVAAEDDAGDVRAVELDRHPFYVATLFQPERAALAGRLPPLVAAFAAAARAHAARHAAAHRAPRSPGMFGAEYAARRMPPAQSTSVSP
jgi:CTP synthase (UTP-ammonia lyase)